jgi:hypothetical protein
VSFKTDERFALKIFRFLDFFGGFLMIFFVSFSAILIGIEVGFFRVLNWFYLNQVTCEGFWDKEIMKCF